jgi:thiamine biosynthesis lipoprotein
MKNKCLTVTATAGGIVLIAVLSYCVYRDTQMMSGHRGRVEADSGHRVVMGTFGHVIAVAENPGTAEKCIERAFEQLNNDEKLMSYHRDDSQVAEINRNAYKNPVKVSKQVFEVLQKAVEFSKVSGGAFDITVGPLVDLWRWAGEANSVPTDAELEQARSKVGYEKLILDANEMSVQFAVEGMKVDLGGIAKGYAIDRAVEAMQESGAIGGMVDIGGEIRCFGLPPAGQRRWRIGLQDPNTVQEDIGTGRPLLVLKLTNAAVATSGHYRRFVVVEGKKYSHILDPKTGTSAESLSSVTIISPNATDADALATAVSVMGAEKGLALIETIPETEAILITSAPEYKLVKTSGAERYVKQSGK